jgi:predicted ATPase
MPVDEQRDLLKRYTRAIVHLRQQHNAGRLSLVFGSGIGRDLEFPMWPTLVEDIVKAAVARGVEAPDKYSSITYQTQIIFQKFRAKRLIDADIAAIGAPLDREAAIRSEWRALVHGNLYANPATSDANKLDEHPYLLKWLPVFRSAALIVNYNFDDVLERLIQRHQKDKSGPITTLGYESFWAPRANPRVDRTPIFHPNGYLPSNLHEKHSDTLVFSEDEFADQLTDLSSSSYQYLFNNLVRNTCLLIGLSLDDGTLKNLLRQNAKLHPGNFHYYVRYIERPDELSEHEKIAISDTNFEIYNLITIFLTKADHGTLAELLSMAPPGHGTDADEFEELAKDIESKFVFYIAGSVASGKTTLLSYFRNTYVFDEWLEPRIPEIVKPSNVLTPSERAIADAWVLKQVRMKNNNLSAMKSGIYFVDRAPLDAFAFTEAGKFKEKAEMLDKEVCGTKDRKRLHSGCVFLLEADPKELQTRMFRRGRSESSADYLADQQEQLKAVYSGGGRYLIDAKCASAHSLARQIAQIVYRQPYVAFECDERLLQVKMTGVL